MQAPDVRNPKSERTPKFVRPSLRDPRPTRYPSVFGFRSSVGQRSALLGMGLAAAAVTLLPAASAAADWPHWGRDASRNMYSTAKNLPANFEVGEFKKGTEEVDMATTKNVKWVAKL